MVSALAENARSARAKAKIVVVFIGLTQRLSSFRGASREANPESRDSGSGADAPARNDEAVAVLLRRHLRLAVADAIDSAVPVVGDEDRAVLHQQHVVRPADIFVVFQEAGDE